MSCFKFKHHSFETPAPQQFWMDRWSRDQPQPGSLFQRLREAEKRDPGNEVAYLTNYVNNGCLATGEETSSRNQTQDVRNVGRVF